MADRILTNKVRAEILAMGMDLVGFAPADRWEHAPYLLSPQAILPEVKTVIVAAIHITDTWTEMGGEPEPQDRSAGGWMDQNSLLDRVAYRTVRLLNSFGHKAIGVASSNIWRYREHPGIPSLFAPDLSHIHAAVAAGLGEIGWSGLAITPEFGSRCRFISIVTNAELVATPMYDGPKLCDMCGECVRHCPTAALRKELHKPHEVKIGGKTYRYANKNIWRCAWAEHFDLDLNSENLKKMEHVGEREILDEIAEKGKRGHERGVCQKFCVPPHLRTRQSSFGRPDKLIAQNRILKRYPENMPTLRKMRDDIISAATGMGVDLCVVAPLVKDVPTVEGYSVSRELPGARTIVAFGMRIPPELRASSMIWPFDLMMHHICLRIARMVEDYGYHAASYNWAHELCEQAGIGIRGSGRFRELASPEFNDDMITGAVVTDALIDPSPASVKIDKPRLPARPGPEKLRLRLEAIAEDNLVCLFGIAPANRFDKAVVDLKANVNETDLGLSVTDENHNYHGSWVSRVSRDPATIRGPKDYLPDARSVIVLGMHFPQEIIENTGLEKSQQIGTYAFWQYQTHRELGFAACKLARYLCDLGFKVAITEDMLGIGSKVDSHRGLLPDARCNAIEAVAAGLGQLGPAGSLLTPEYGPHQRQIVLITDADLPCDELYSGPAICKNCGNCRTKCPMNAIDSKTFNVRLNGAGIAVPVIDRNRCDWSKRYALCPEEGPALIGNKTCVPKPEGKVDIEDIAEACKNRDPIMKRRPCIFEHCLHYCTAGRKGNPKGV